MRVLVVLLKIIVTLVALVAVAGVAAFVTIQVMTGKDSVEVPSVVGAQVPDAIRSLDAVKLRIHIEEDDKNSFDDVVPAGSVLRQNPPAGAFLKQDRKVRVWLSLGPRDVYVPRVVGEALRAAQNRIHEAGLQLGSIVYVPSPVVPQEVVIDQEPTRLGGSDDRVSLLVSAGADAPGFVMPDVLGAPGLRVRSFLERNGFRVRMESEPYDGIPEGTVVRQKPLAGYLARAGDTVWLWQSRTTREAFGP